MATIDAKELWEGIEAYKRGDFFPINIKIADKETVDRLAKYIHGRNVDIFENYLRYKKQSI